MKYIVKAGDRFLSIFMFDGRRLNPILSDNSAVVYDTRMEVDEAAKLVPNSKVYEVTLKECG